jgi:hypothetical protein
MIALSVLALGVTPSADAADVRIGVNIGVPGPVVVAPPAPVVIAPGSPVYYYGTSYYTFHDGGWYLGPAYGGPWTFVPVARVPRPIIAVPHAYHRMPPGHVHHIAGPPPWHYGHGHKHHGHGHGNKHHGHGNGHRKHKN